jgi:hypothetical protein
MVQLQVWQSRNWDLLPSRDKTLWHVDPFLGNDCKISSFTTAVARQWLSNNHVGIPTDMNKQRVFSAWSVPRCYKQATSSSVSQWSGVGRWLSEIDNCWRSVVVSRCCEKLVAEARDSLRTQRKGNINYWKPLPSNSSEDVTVDTSVRACVCV